MADKTKITCPHQKKSVVAKVFYLVKCWSLVMLIREVFISNDPQFPELQRPTYYFGVHFVWFFFTSLILLHQQREGRRSILVKGLIPINEPLVCALAQNMPTNFIPI